MKNKLAAFSKTQWYTAAAQQRGCEPPKQHTGNTGIFCRNSELPAGEPAVISWSRFLSINIYTFIFYLHIYWIYLFSSYVTKLLQARKIARAEDKTICTMALYLIQILVLFLIGHNSS